MDYKHYKDKRYEDALTLTINGHEYTGDCFDGIRLDKDTIPEGYTSYGIRHSDDDITEPATISLNYPLVNFFGTFVYQGTIPITEETDIENWSYL